jgi:FkbM family methyltransferase
MKGYFMEIFGKIKKDKPLEENKNWKNLLVTPSMFVKSDAERTTMTISCRDADKIPKVKNAGKVISYDNKSVQIMHNGIKVIAGRYYGDWMIDIIKRLNGHHEPQEEAAFYEVLKNIDKNKPSYMIELGSFWSYYSLWFAKQNNKNHHNICCEPDSTNIQIGKMNAKINKLTDIIFVQSAAGGQDKKLVSIEKDSERGTYINVQIRTVDSLMKEHDWPNLDILHIDVQGQELGALEGAIKTIQSGKLRFLFVSTHHYHYSGDPLTHKKCLDFINKNNGHVIVQHAVSESFSGDGLIVASFHEKDNDLKIKLSINSSYESLFRSPDIDLAIMIEAYEQLSKGGE